MSRRTLTLRTPTMAQVITWRIEAARTLRALHAVIVAVVIVILRAVVGIPMKHPYHEVTWNTEAGIVIRDVLRSKPGNTRVAAAQSSVAPSIPPSAEVTEAVTLEGNAMTLCRRHAVVVAVTIARCLPT